jgi:hypothetical protein
MKFATACPYSDPEAAARKLIEIANSVEAVQDGRIYIELVNTPFLYEHKAALSNTRPVSIWRSPGVGWCCTSPGPT